MYVCVCVCMCVCVCVYVCMYVFSWILTNRKDSTKQASKDLPVITCLINFIYVPCIKQLP